MTDVLRRASRALISVSDKTGLVAFAGALSGYGIELISTGGTRKALTDARLNVTEVSDVTGFPEMMDGRVKTLHPAVHGGILAIRGNAAHVEAMRAHRIRPIDLVVVNLYPFEQTAARGAGFDDCIENIDIGGPALIRAAAKNHGDVVVVVEPIDYAALLDEFARHGGMTTLALRRRLAAKAYARTAAYDAAIANWFANELGNDAPDFRSLGGRLIEELRYGENPHQTAAFYRTPEARFGVATARQAQGKQLSYNNINDTDAAFECVAEFDPARAAACAIIKHTNPCGVAEGESLIEAYRKALACDPVSAFGGIVALNRPLDAEAARAITEIFTEVIIAPDASDDAIAIVGAKKNLRLLIAGGLPDPRARGLTAKTVAGGLLVQSRDNAVVDDMDLKPVTKRAPSNAELRDLRFAFRVAKHVKSNTIVYAKDSATVGIGAGQMSRIDSARIAARKAQDAAQAAGRKEPATKGSVVASDAFFPFADGLLVAIEAGATAVIQPGGSVRDDEVIKAADDHGIAMVFTGTRHFRHWRSSCPALCRASTSWRTRPKDADGRVKPGHDDVITMRDRASHRAGDPLFELRLRRGADLAGGELAVLEQHQGRDRHDAELGGGVGVLVDIELDDLDLAVERLGNLFQRRRDHFARAAPFRPEIDHHRSGRLDDILIERGVGCFVDHGSTSLFRWTIVTGTQTYEWSPKASREAQPGRS
jgi:phosphoribosylaminoimidazolecarboxamide formyltransferase / IMP cyclohydrolase